MTLLSEVVLYKMVNSKPNFMVLGFPRCIFIPKSFDIMIDTIEKFRIFTGKMYIDFSDCNLTANCFLRLTEAINSLGDCEIILELNFDESLKDQRVVPRDVNLTGSEISKHIVNLIRRPVNKKFRNIVKNLSISDNDLNIDVVSSITDELKYNKSLTVLNICKNNLGLEGGNKLIEMLRINNTLTTIRFESNSIPICDVGKIKYFLRINNVYQQSRSKRINNFEDEKLKNLIRILIISIYIYKE